MVRAFTLTEVLYRLHFAPQITLSDLTHIGGSIFMIMRLDGIAALGAGFRGVNDVKGATHSLEF